MIYMPTTPSGFSVLERENTSDDYLKNIHKTIIMY